VPAKKEKGNKIFNFTAFSDVEKYQKKLIGFHRVNIRISLKVIFFLKKRIESIPLR